MVKKIRIAMLEDVQAAARLALERDLRTAPTPVSGGMRKALAKEAADQDGLRYRSRRRPGEADLLKTYGLIQAVCGRCRHIMYFDEIEDFGAVRCDRCRRPISG